jgi:aryl-alcohol dehydrogenase-like predicted oxidoreductase
MSMAGIAGRRKTHKGRIGLGAWSFGRAGWGAQDDRDSIATILRAVESGINWIDTASVYGGGHSELVVGRALSQLTEDERPLVSTKGGIRIDTVTGRTYRDLSPETLRADCEASLTRLCLDSVDIYHLHWPVDDDAVVAEAWHTLGELQREGKIRSAAVSNFDVAQLRLCTAIRPIDAVQLPLSLVDRSVVPNVLSWATRHGVSSLVYSPLGSGILSNRFSLERLSCLPQEDWRGRRPQFQATELRRAQTLVKLVGQIAEELGKSIVEVAIAWTLSWPGVGGAIVGARTPAQLEGWRGAAELELDDRTLDALSWALTQSGAGTGPTRPPAGLDQQPT